MTLLASSMSVSSDHCSPPGDQNFTPDAIQRLLCEAETRLREPSNSQTADNNTNDQLSLSLKSTNPPSKPHVPSVSSEQSLKPYIEQEDDVAIVDASQMVTEGQRRQSNIIRRVESTGWTESRVKKDKITAGSEWFDLPKTDLSADVKRDLQLLRMRSVLDPKRHYKKDSGSAPEYSHIGTLIEGPTEFFSSRIAKKDRKRTFVDETLAAGESNSRFKDKYNQIQEKKTSGKKSYYKKLQAKRKPRNKSFG